jgi:hypothetical protein
MTAPAVARWFKRGRRMTIPRVVRIGMTMFEGLIDGDAAGGAR